MERLTDRKQRAYYPRCFEQCDGIGSTSECDRCDFNDTVCERLAEYEDTGLTPEEINNLKEKQILKPIIPMNFGEYYVCPICKVHIFYGRRKPLKYCEDCGQAITGPEKHWPTREGD